MTSKVNEYEVQRMFGIEEIEPSKYLGSDEDSVLGLHDLPSDLNTATLIAAALEDYTPTGDLPTNLNQFAGYTNLTGDLQSLSLSLGSLAIDLSDVNSIVDVTQVGMVTELDDTDLIWTSKANGIRESIEYAALQAQITELSDLPAAESLNSTDVVYGETAEGDKEKIPLSLMSLHAQHSDDQDIKAFLAALNAAGTITGTETIPLFQGTELVLANLSDIKSYINNLT